MCNLLMNGTKPGFAGGNAVRLVTAFVPFSRGKRCRRAKRCQVSGTCQEPFRYKKNRVFGSWCFYRRGYFYRRFRRERISRYDLAAARLGYGSHETQGKRRLAECVVRVHTRYPCDT
jgi:hypothetical protein